MSSMIKYLTEDISTRKKIEKTIQEWNDSADFIEIQTSGSTGNPKIIKLDKKYMRASVQMTGAFFKYKPGQKMGICLSTDGVGGKMALIRALEFEMDVIVLPTQQNPFVPLDCDLDFISMVPIQLNKVLEESPEKLAMVKSVLLGGAPVPSSLMNKLQDISPVVYGSFGMTETISHIALRRLNKGFESKFSCLPGIQVAESEEKLIIHAPTLGIKELVTNDRVFIHDSTHFEWLGRLDFVINAGGKKISPEQIERKLEIHLNNRFFISSFPHEEWNETLVLFIESDEAPEKFKSIPLATILEKHEIPKIIVTLKAFVETETSKINRIATRTLYLEKMN